ncbi:MAG TPA: DUF4282 domain-containing protein [Gemmata sp.]
MPVVSCPHCSQPVSLPNSWSGAAYTCPHCRRVVAGSKPKPEPEEEEEEEEEAPRRKSRKKEEDFAIDPEPLVRPRQRRSSGPIVDFFTFRLMITPIIIQIVFWLGVLASVGQGMVLIVGSFAVPAGVQRAGDFRDPDRPLNNADKQKVNAAATSFSIVMFASGLAVMAIGPLLTRLYCELLIIIFKIHDELKLANDRQQYRT